MLKTRLAIFIMTIALLLIPFAGYANFGDEVKLTDSLYRGSGAISIDGDTAIIGSKLGYVGDDRTGYAEVYTHDPGTGEWSLQQKLFATAGAAEDWFGHSVSVSGDRAVIGAISQGSFGTAYVFERDPGTEVWTEIQTLPPSDNPLGQYGGAVAISGDWAVVGATFATGGGGGIVTRAGAAYTFKRNSDTGVWEFFEKLWDSGATTGNGGKYAIFGSTVDIDGTFLIIGAPNSSSTTVKGIAFIYEFNTTRWKLEREIWGAEVGDYLGGSVAIDGDTAIMSASGVGSGVSYVYVRNAGTGAWSKQATLPVSGNVAVSDDIAIIGDLRDDELATGAGAAWVYERDPGTGGWTGSKLLASDGAASDNFGKLVDISGSLAMIGADEAVYFYKNSTDAVDETPPVVTSVTPVDGATSVDSTSVVTATFIEAMDATTITTANFTLAGGGAVAGAVTYDAGSRTATFTPSADLAYSTEYTATVTTGVTDLADNNMAADYVWTFTTGVAPDLTSPTVVSVLPVDGATDVATNTTVTITFNETMHALALRNSFTLSDGAAVAGTITLGTGQLAATFTPSADLDFNTTYTATVTTEATDLAGNPLASDEVWSFTTGVNPDNTPPTVTNVTPADGTTSVPLNATVTATFDEEMDPTTISATSFTLSNGGAVGGVVSFNQGTMTATFVPSSALTEATTYTATITTGAADTAGNGLASLYTWTFATIDTTIDSDGDGVIDAEDDYPNDQTRATPVATSGTGKVLVDTSANDGTVLTNCRCVFALDPSLNHAGWPSGYSFIDGLIACDVENVTPGGTVELSLTFPTTYLENALYYKVDSAGFYEFFGALINGDTVTLTLVDGGAGDSDGVANGVIQDPGGVGTPAPSSTSSSGQPWYDGGCFLETLQ